MLRGVLDILKFNAYAKDFIKKSPNLSLGELIQKMNLKAWFRDYYILPMGGAIWSCPSNTMLNFPATTFVNFFENHGLLSLKNRPQWHTLKNKSKEYVRALEISIEKNGIIKKNTNISYIDCSDGKIKIKEEGKESIIYDEVLFACHPVEILSLLRSIKPDMKNTLIKFTREKNIAYTHSDKEQMPKEKKCWSSWNYLYKKSDNDSRVAVTYWMNKLQHIDNNIPLFVTLNPISPIPKDNIYDVHQFHHPVFDQAAIDGQFELNHMQGYQNIWFCGAYLRYGFHEDGVWSAAEVSKKIIKSDQS
jgi:predicted NAD/FAD-binding protein